MNKRGMSLIAIVLIIVMTISIAGVVFLFTQKITSKGMEEVGKDEDCLKIKIKILEACHNNEEIKIKIESKTEKIIDKGFLIKATGENDILLPSPAFTAIDGFTIEDFTFPYPQEIGELQEITVIPKIKRQDQSQLICSVQADKKSVNPC